MARRVRTWKATQGRDAGKTFVITEMPADQAERWALRAGFAIANAGVKVPDGVLDSGMAGLASLAHVLVWCIRSLQGLHYNAVEDLLDDLMGCVQFQPPGTGPEGAPLPPVQLFKGENSQVEEIRTWFWLKVEAFQCHVDFSLADALSSFQKTAAPAAQAPSA